MTASEVGAPILRSSFFLAGLLFFLVLERVCPYRSPTISKPKRWAANLLLVGFNNICILLIFSAIVAATLAYAQLHRTGVLNTVPSQLSEGTPGV